MGFLEDALWEDEMKFGTEIDTGTLSSTLQDANDPSNAIQSTPTATSAVQAAATAVIENPASCSGDVDPLITAFQNAYNATSPASPLNVDGRYGPLTKAALSQYGAAPPVGGSGGGVNVPVSPGSQTGTGHLVERIATPISGQEFANALATVWPIVIGGAAPAVAIRLLLAQSDFETGGWKSCWNWNFGNVKHVPGDGTDWFVMTASEGSGASKVMVSSMFRSYPTMQEGAKAYLSIFHKRFSAAWPYIISGDVVSFVQALKNERYFTGDLTDYTSGVKVRLAKYTGIVPTIQQLENFVAPAAPAATAAVKAGAIGFGGYIIGGGFFLAGLFILDAFRRK